MGNVYAFVNGESKFSDCYFTAIADFNDTDLILFKDWNFVLQQIIR